LRSAITDIWRKYAQWSHLERETPIEENYPKENAPEEEEKKIKKNQKAYIKKELDYIVLRTQAVHQPFCKDMEI